MRDMNIAVIGTGYIGVQHIRAVATEPRANLHTICATARSKAQAEALGAEHGAVRVTTEFQRVLDDATIGLVIICTPNSRHVGQAVAALDAGKHVLCEKPLAVSVPQCRRIVEAVRRSGRTLMVGHGARFSKMHETIKQIVSDGLLGEACFVESDYVHDLGPFLALPGHDWWLDSEKEGQLPVIGGACHPLDLMRWIGGEIVAVSAFGANRNLPSAPWHDTIIANVTFASGAVGKCLTCCGAKVPYALNFSYYGTKGTVKNDRIFLDGIPNVADFMQLPVEVRREDHKCGIELAHLLDCIESGAEPRINAVDGARSVAVCCAVTESLESGGPVGVELEF
ncbi:MAG: Gfo/Idh/MocA family oxidoreductase [Kiritimatiellae bacterium]|nr:Gfo/Idh/MocA family oxidoreductase [Kiritimatiellia bacterium]